MALGRQWTRTNSPYLTFNKAWSEGLRVLIRLRDRSTYYGLILAFTEDEVTLSDCTVKLFQNGSPMRPSTHYSAKLIPEQIYFVGAQKQSIEDRVETLDRLMSRSS